VLHRTVRTKRALSAKTTKLMFKLSQRRCENMATIEGRKSVAEPRRALHARILETLESQFTGIAAAARALAAAGRYGALDCFQRIRQRGKRGIERILASATASCGLRPSRHAARKLECLARSKRAGLPISASTLASHGRYEA
jgi:hypothetical protein